MIQPAPRAKRQTSGHGRRGRKKVEPREQLSRERIIAAAVEVLDERGLEGFTMRALGERLGVEAMAVYHYFPNKQALLEALGTGVDIAAFFGGFVGLPMAGRSAADLVVELGMRYLKYARENPAQFTLLFSVLPIDYASLVHGLAMLRHTRLRALEADFDTLHRTLLEQLVNTFKGAR